MIVEKIKFKTIFMIYLQVMQDRKIIDITNKHVILLNKKLSGWSLKSDTVLTAFQNDMLHKKGFDTITFFPISCRAWWGGAVVVV